MFAPETSAPSPNGEPASRASMRPGHVCPGNSSARGGGRSRLRGFNEAGACLPRKRCVRGQSVRSPRRASMRPGHVCPGNAPPALEERACILASMRPGHVCPGNTGTSAGRSPTARRFNEAGACLPRKHTGAHGPILRHRRFNEAGACLPRKLVDYGRAASPIGQASMRPGHVCPGNHHDQRLRQRHPAGASMRPGHVCPGNMHMPYAKRRVHRRFNEAGACLPRKRGRRGGNPRVRLGFNEAGACLPRKLGLSLDRAPALAQLQ